MALQISNPPRHDEWCHDTSRDHGGGNNVGNEWVGEQIRVGHMAGRVVSQIGPNDGVKAPV